MKSICKLIFESLGILIILSAMNGCGSGASDAVGDETNAVSGGQTKPTVKLQAAPPITDMGKMIGAAYYSNGDKGGLPDTNNSSCLNLEHFDFGISTDGDGIQTKQHLDLSQDTATQTSELAIHVAAEASYSIFSAYANLDVDNSSVANANQMKGYNLQLMYINMWYT